MITNDYLCGFQQNTNFRRTVNLVLTRCLDCSLEQLFLCGFFCFEILFPFAVSTSMH